MRRWTSLLVLLATGLAGVVALVMEVAGAQALAPGFGTGLNAWGAMISVTLGFMACGYVAGGSIADQRPDRARRILTSALALAAAGCVADALFWKDMVLGLASLGFRLGAVVSAVALFGLPLMVLGAVYPLAVKARTRTLGEVGRSVGWLSASSAAGSLLGAALAGFVLVPSLAIESVFAACGAALLLGAAGINLAGRGGKPVAAVLALLAILPLAMPGRGLPPGLLCRRGSLFGPIEVWQSGLIRYLMVARTCQGIGLGEPPVSFLPHVSVISKTVGANLRPGQGEVLLIGLGAGFLPRSLETPTARTGGWGPLPVRCQTVEIDPAILDVATRYFAFDPVRHPVHIADGRAFLLANPTRYQAIIIDAFGGLDLPYHLFTRECFALARQRLTADGLLIINYEGFLDGDGNRLVQSLERTLRSVFAEVEIYVNEKQAGYGNVIFAAHGRGAVVEWPQEPEYRARQTFLAGELGVVLTDSRNPISLWSARMEGPHRSLFQDSN